MQLQQMQEEIAQLRGMLEEQQNQIQRLQQEGLERYQDLDRRLSSGPAASSNQSAPSREPAAAGGAGASAASSGQSQSASGDPAQEKLYYDAAFDLIKAKDFDKASQAFAAFLRKYPDSQYAGNAQYWLGEVNLAKGDLQGAGQALPASVRLIRSTARCRTRFTSWPMSRSAWAIATRPRDLAPSHRAVPEYVRGAVGTAPAQSLNSPALTNETRPQCGFFR